MGRDGRPLRARDYCVLHLKQRHADFDRCSVQECSQAPHYLFWTQTPRQVGDPTWTRYYELCPAHTKAWCTAHQVDIGAIPTISLADWGRVWLASVSDYDQLPWFRLASPVPAPRHHRHLPRPQPGSAIRSAGSRRPCFRRLGSLRPVPTPKYGRTLERSARLSMRRCKPS